MINNLNSLKKKIETLLFKYNEQKKINQDLETKIEYLIRSNQDLEKYKCGKRLLRHIVKNLNSNKRFYFNN